MHLFLTGARRVGKSTAIAKALQRANVTPDGFVTVFAELNGERALLLLPAGSPCARDASRIVARASDGRMAADTARFDALGAACLQNAADARLILMDECGYLEKDAAAFQRAALAALDGGTPVLGVVREGAGGWTDGIRAHPRVRLRTVTEQNRNETADAIYKWILEETHGNHD